MDRYCTVIVFTGYKKVFWVFFGFFGFFCFLNENWKIDIKVVEYVSIYYNLNKSSNREIYKTPFIIPSVSFSLIFWIDDLILS